MARTIMKHTADAEPQLQLFNDRPIYGGDAILYDPQGTVPGYAVRPERKPAVRKTKMSTVMVVVFMGAVAGLVYTSNVITVLALGKEMNELTTRYNTVISTNEVLRADINRKSNLERITMMARTTAGMINPREAPSWFEIDHARIEDLSSRSR